jgi:hypothetical protein
MLLISGGHKANGCGDIRPLSPNVRGDGPLCKSLTGVFASAWHFSQSETGPSKSAIRSRLIWYGDVSLGL